MQTARLVLGWVALAVGAGIILAGYSNRPDAGTCAAISGIQHQLGQAAACSTGPGGGTFVVAGLLAAAGIWLLAWHYFAGKQAR